MTRFMEPAEGPLVLARHELARDRPDRALEALARVTGPELETYDFWSLRACALCALRLRPIRTRALDKPPALL
jgi:hypothetical protein